MHLCQMAQSAAERSDPNSPVDAGSIEFDGIRGWFAIQPKKAARSLPTILQRVSC